MRLPQRPPKADRETVERALELLGSTSDSAREAVAKADEANERYLYWDDVRHRPWPPGVTAAAAWTLMKIKRGPSQPTPIFDAGGRPFTYRLPESLNRPLHLIDRRAGTELVSTPGRMPGYDARDRLLMSSLMEEAVSTSQIEGAVTTIKRGKDLLRSGRKPTDHNERMVVNGYRTMRLIRDRMHGPLDLNLLHEIQTTVTDGTLEEPERQTGRFRDDDTVHVVSVQDSETMFTPPPAATLDGEIERLIDFANTSADEGEGAFVHPLIRATMLHFWLAYLHPYRDGNGRTARGLFYWYMLRNGYTLFEFLTVSRVIHDSRTAYYRTFLHTERDDNDLTYFLLYNVRAVEKAVAQLHERVDAVRQEQERILAIRTAADFNGRQRAVIDHALRHPHQMYTFESHAASHDIGYQTSRVDLLGLAERGLLVQKSKRPVTFLPATDLRQRLGLDA